MAVKDKTTLKGYFNTNDTPSESNFADFIDTIGMASLVVAASDSSDASKGRADYVCDGTDDDVQIQAAIDAIRDAGKGGKIVLSEGHFYCSETLDITIAYGITIMGSNTGSSIIHSSASNKPAIDMVGSLYLLFSDIRIEGDGTNTPTIAFLMARATVQSSALNTFERVSAIGEFTDGVWYDFSVERCVWSNCSTYVTNNSSTEFGIYLTAHNDKSYTSAFATISDVHSCSVNYIHDCSIEGFNSTAFIPIVISEGVHELTLRDCFLSYSGIYSDILIKGAHLDLIIENIFAESLATQFIEHKTYSGSTDIIAGLRVVNCGSDNYSNAIFYGNPGTTVSHATFDNLRGPLSGSSKIIFATIEYSVVRSWWTNPSSGGLIATTAKWCELTYPPSGYTITNSTDNILHFSGTLIDYSDDSTITGWTSYTTKKIFYHQEGKKIFVQFYISGTSNSTSTSFTLPLANNASIITGGPVGAVNNSVAISGAISSMGTSSYTVSFYTTQLGAGWADSNTKEIFGQFWYFKD